MLIYSFYLIDMTTGSGAATPTVVTTGPGSGPTPGSASGLGSTSAPGSGVSASGTNTNISTANDVASISLSALRGPPRHLTIAPHPHTKKLEPVIHSAPVNGGFFHGAKDMKASAMSGVAMKGVGISSVRFRTAHHSTNDDYNSTSSMVSGLGVSANPLPSASGCVHPPVTPMRIPELHPIPITPGGRKGPHHNNHGISGTHVSQGGGHSNTSSQQLHSHPRPLPPHSAGLPHRIDKESTERPPIIGGDRLVLDRERLELDRGASIAIAKNGGMRSGVVLGSGNVPRTPLFSSFGQKPSGNPNTTRLPQGRSVSTSNSHIATSGKHLQVPYTAGLIPSSSGNEALSSSHIASRSRQAGPHTAGLPSTNAAALNISRTASVSSTPPDPKSSFLTLFSDFYESLADSKLLKSWLHEQLVKSSGLIEQLEKAASGHANTSSSSTPPDISYPTSSTAVTLTLAQLEELIERRLGPVRNETEGLRRRVGELEEMVYEVRKNGWGRDMETSRNSRRHEDRSHPPGAAVFIHPPVSLRTSPPPPLNLSATPNSRLTVNNPVLRAPVSAPLPLDRPSSHLGITLTRDVVGVVDVRMKDVAETNDKCTRSDTPRSHSQSHSRSRTKSRADGTERQELLSHREDAPCSRSTTKSPLLSPSSILNGADNVMANDIEQERSRDTKMDISVDDDVDRPMIVSASEHRVSAIRLES